MKTLSRPPRPSPLPGQRAIRTAADYDALLQGLYLGVKTDVEEVVIPPVKVICVDGNEPPGGEQYQQAIAILYGLAYSLKMGLKFGKIARPAGWFDHKVGALETLWWSSGSEFEIGNAKTLRWRAYLMVPPFVSRKLLDSARVLASAKQPGTPYELAKLETVHEGRSIQALHVGPYAAEQPTIDALHAYAAEHGLIVAGKHHEIYLSDPGRTKPEKLKTVLRYPVKRAPRRRASRE